MGAGSPELLLDGIGGGGQAVPDIGGRLRAGIDPGPERETSNAACGVEFGDQARAGSEADEGLVSMSAPGVRPSPGAATCGFGWLAKCYRLSRRGLAAPGDGRTPMQM